VIGVIAETPKGRLTVQSNLVIGADGRHSTMRDLTGLQVEDSGAAIDVFWFRITRHKNDPHFDEIFGRFMAGKMVVFINRNDYWQCGFIIPKGSAEAVKSQDIQTFREMLVKVAPAGILHTDHIQTDLKSWDDVRLLSVKIDRLKKWYVPGLLCIGDAAHAMSPIGGVGINMAVQDAIATANMLSPVLKLGGEVPLEYLEQVQSRRTFPTKVIQWLQKTIQNRILQKVLSSKNDKLQLPWILKMILQRTSILQKIAGYIIGIGVRPEHVTVKLSQPITPM